MRKTRLRAVPALVGAITSALALGAIPALGDQIHRIRKCTTIDQPGSYVVTRNLTAVDDCLVVAADFVSIDLGGWVITSAGAGTGAGVTDQGDSRQGIVVRNGTVTGFLVGAGVDLDGTNGAVVEKVRAFSSQFGIIVGPHSIVSGNIVEVAAINGITAGFESIVSGNTALGQSAAISVGRDSIVSGNTARGEVGIRVGARSTVSGNKAAGEVSGFIIEAGSTFSGNTAEWRGSPALGGAALMVSCPSNIIGNTALGGLPGALVLDGDGCTIIDNLVSPP